MIIKNNLKSNIFFLLNKQQKSLLQLADMIGVNIMSLERLFDLQLISLTNPLLKKISDVLACSTNQLLFSVNDHQVTISCDNSLLNYFEQLDIELFIQSVKKVDQLASDNHMIDQAKKAQAYLAFYQLAKMSNCR